MSRKVKSLLSIILSGVFLVTCVPYNALAAQKYGTAEEHQTAEEFAEVDFEEIALEKLMYDHDAAPFAMHQADTLTDEERKVYFTVKEIVENIAQNGGTTEIQIQTPDLLAGKAFGSRDNMENTVDHLFLNVIRCLKYDYPELFYWQKNQDLYYISYSFYQSNFTIVDTMTLTFEVDPEYQGANSHQVDPGKMNRAKQAIQNAKKEAEVIKNSGSDDVEKLRAVKNRICELTDYNFDALDSYYWKNDAWQLINVFDQDESTKVVCEGYSKGFQYLSDLVFSDNRNVEVYSVTGILNSASGTAEAHMWNLVRYNGSSYLTDVTNCDQGTALDTLFMLNEENDSVLKNEDGSYTVTGWGGEDLTYTYDDDVIGIYGTDILTLKAGNADSHMIEFVEGVPATCTEDGIKEHYKCSQCGKIFSDAAGTTEIDAAALVIKATGHDWGEWKIEKKPTEKENGLKYRVCSQCGDKETEIIPALTGMWKSNNKGWWYEYSDGTIVESEFKEIGGQTYYFKADGYMATGWQQIDGRWYVFDRNGHMLHDCWEGDYYLGPDGIMLMEPEYEINGKTYYFDANGKWIPQGWQSDLTGYWYVEGNTYIRSDFKEVGGKTYYFRADGYMATGWQEIGGSWYVFDGSGAMLHDCWYQGIYYLDSNGKMLTSTETPDHYYVGADGRWLPQSWKSNSKGYWYEIGNTYIKSDFKEINGKTYYFGADGYMVTGWQEIGGKWYVFDGSGAMLHDTWYEGIYYLDSDGVMLTSTETPDHYYVDAKGRWLPQGWQGDYSTGFWYNEGASCITSSFKEIGGETYYFDGNGWMAADWQEIGGKWYVFDRNGHMLHDCWYQSIYYLGSDGAMLTSRFTPDGYWVGPDGKYTQIVSDAYSSPLYVAIEEETKLFTVPKINIAGAEVQAANEELYNMGNEAYYEVYDQAQQGFSSFIKGSDYVTYLDETNQIVSVILRIRYIHPPHEYKVINVSISDGHVLSNEELGSIKGYTPEDLREMYIKGIQNWYKGVKDIYGEFLTEEFYNDSISEENLNEISLFLNENGKLTMKVRVFYPAGAGNCHEDIVIE